MTFASDPERQFMQYLEGAGWVKAGFATSEQPTGGKSFTQGLDRETKTRSEK
jgi:hypothetical protein